MLLQASTQILATDYQHLIYGCYRNVNFPTVVHQLYYLPTLCQREFCSARVKRSKSFQTSIVKYVQLDYLMQPLMEMAFDQVNSSNSDNVVCIAFLLKYLVLQSASLVCIPRPSYLSQDLSHRCGAGRPRHKGNEREREIPQQPA